MISINPSLLKNIGQMPHIEQIEQIKRPEFQLSLADRDKYLQQIEQQIAAKRKLLLNKRNYLEKTLKENAFLDGVKKDYQKYRNYIVKEKQDQLRAMNILKQYTEDLVVSTKMTEANIKETKRDQKEILREMERIKRELDEIIDVPQSQLKK
jgi:hypothetical protein